MKSPAAQPWRPTTVSVTGARPEKPSARAAADVTSITRPRTNGPRSLIRTTTERPLRLWVTRTSVPNGRVLWAAVMPLAAAVPFCRPTMMETAPRTQEAASVGGLFFFRRFASAMSAIGTKRTWHRGWLISLSEVKRTYSSLAGRGVLGPR